MKHIYKVFGICGFLLLSFATLKAQSVDVLRDMADPNTRLFSDGKSDVVGYVNATLSAKSACYGEDNVYIQVKVDDCGFPTSVRALNGKKECIKKSVEDIVKHIRWNVTNGAKPGNIIFNLKIKIDSTGGKANTYQAIAEPNGWTAVKEKALASKEGCIGGAKAGSSQQAANQTGQQGGGDNPNNSQSNNANNSSANNTASTGNPPVNSSQSSNNSSGGGGKSGGVMTQSLVAKSVDTTGLKKKLGPETLPDPKYVSRGVELKPDDSHKKSITNQQGPVYARPTFVDGESGMGIFIKTMFRRFNYCGMAQAYAEVTVEKDGTVSGYRIFKTNNDKVQALTPYVLGSLRFRPVEFKTNFYFQFQTDVDCEGFPRNPVDKTKFYFTAPDKAPRAPKEGGSSQMKGGDEGDVLKKQKDE